MKLIDRVSSIINYGLPTGLLLSTTTEEVESVGQTVPVLHVHYRSGNEYINLIYVIDELKKLGETIAAYHGRGTNEKPRLAFEVTDHERNRVVVLWHLDDVSA
jgi:hypothetical protein